MLGLDKIECEDAVSRKWLIEVVKNAPWHSEHDANYALHIVRELAPSVTPKPKTGKWIPHKSVFGGLGERVYTCDQCGYNIGFHVENFCPGCGSRMTEGLHDSD